MIWALFLILVFVLIALDLGVFHKKNVVVTMQDSLKRTGFWFLLALLFGLVVYVIYDKNWMDVNPMNVAPMDAMLDYYAGYLIEESLSLDNIFVIALIFKFFKIEQKYQHNILFWGILGAVVFRLIMIFLGTAFVHKFEWSTYVFGGILIYSGLKMLKNDDEDADFKNSFAVRMLSKLFKINWDIRDGRYFVRENGKRVATAFFAALIVIEFSDVIFAIDSIPAIFSITTDPFIVFASNIFAILGLRNLYFFLANMLDKFHYMKFALIGVLLFVGTKMMIVHFVKIPTSVSLLVILSLLVSGVLYSSYSSRKIS
ncbi:MAG: TerC/Alx family metal homeostasis membrane protein [Bacteroidetes bacterium]|nr:TerC/Alx family metal homeostasis membrane protein [Bacteroidota bacterium]